MSNQIVMYRYSIGFNYGFYLAGLGCVDAVRRPDTLL